MSIPWKQFQLYESVPIRDPLLGNKDPLYSDPTLTAATTLLNDNILIISIHDNIIKFVDLEKSQVLFKFKAMDDSSYQITHLKTVITSISPSSTTSTGNKKNNIRFLMVILESIGKPSILRFFKIDHILRHATKNNNNNKISYHSQIEVKNGNNTFTISAIDISSDLSCIAIGFLDGKVIIVRGDIARDRGSRQRIIYEDRLREPITSLSLNSDASLCFVTTISKVFLFNTFGRNKGLPDLTLNKQNGVNLNCSNWNKYNQKFYCYMTNNLNNGDLTFSSQPTLESYKINNEREILPLPNILRDLINIKVKRIHMIDNSHILFIVEETNSESTSALQQQLSTIYRFIIVDIKNNIISFNSIVNDPILDIIGTNKNGKLLLLSTNGILYQLSMKSVDDQINILIQKENFKFAIDLAQQNRFPEYRVQEIHKFFADYLFKRGQQEEAIQEYIQCLDIVETSEIISKFGSNEINESSSISSHKTTATATTKPESIKNLSNYLWALVKSNKSSSDHVTLLLIILIKLKAVKEIDHFIHHYSREGKYCKDIIENDIDNETYLYSDKTLFNLTLILDLLKDSDLLIEAYEIAKRFAKDPITIITILLDDLNEPIIALTYIKSLPIDDTLRILVKFSKQLLESLPNDTNALLIDVFTGNYKPKEYNTDIKKRREIKKRDSDLTKIFYSYRTFFNYMNRRIGSDENAKERLDNSLSLTTTYHPPKPSLMFSSFVSKPFQFIVFLEACLETYQHYEGFKEDMQVILTTLYDLYLRLAEEDEPERQNEWKQKAINVWKRSSKLVGSADDISSRFSTNGNRMIDNSLMMLISHMNNIHVNPDDIDVNGETVYNDGTDILTVFNSMTLTETPMDCFNFFTKNVDRDNNLVKPALKYFISSEEVLNGIGGPDILRKRVIDKVVEENITSMLDLIQILSTTDVVKFGLIQDILVKHIQIEEEENKKNMKLIDSYQEELNVKKVKLEEILQIDRPTQINVKNQNCYVCETPLELPIVYFKCKHIYHQRCLDEDERSSDEDDIQSYRCPKCIFDLETSNKLYAAQEGVAKDNELLEKVLDSEEGQKDRFKVVTEFIGRGGLEYGQITIPEE